MAKKRVKVHYRKLHRGDDQFPAATLSEQISAALLAEVDGAVVGENVRHRIVDAPRHDGYKRLLNNHYSEDDFVFGDVCMFSPGEMQAFLRLEQQSARRTLADVMKALEVNQRPAPDGHEYLNGITYWFCTGDHFYQIQHVALGAKAMEEYLTWLLAEKSRVIGTQHAVRLDVEFDRSQVGDNLGDIQAIEVGGLVPETIRPPSTDRPEAQGVPVEGQDVSVHEKLAEQMRAGWGKAREVIVALFGPIEAEKIFESVPSDASLEVMVNIGYRSTRRKFSKAFMGEIATGLRNAPEGELRVRGRNGVIKGDDARLSMDMNVRTISEKGGVLDLEDALEQMREVHRRFLHDGKIGS